MYDCKIETKYDAIYTGDSYDDIYEFYNCILDVQGPSSTNQGGEGLNIGNLVNNVGTIRLFGGSINVINQYSHNYGVYVWNYGNVELYGTKITTSGAQTNRDLSKGSKGILSINGVYYDTTKTFGTITYLDANPILTSLKTVDGASSGLDADLLDGQEGSYYATASGYIPYTGASSAVNLNGQNLSNVGTLGAGVSTLSGGNANNPFTLLNLNNTVTPTTGQVGQTSDLVFNLTGQVRDIVALSEAAKIRAYKVSDWWHASALTDHDSGLKFYTTHNGTSTLQLTISDVGTATFVGNLNAGSITGTTGEFDSGLGVGVAPSSDYGINIEGTGKTIGVKFINDALYDNLIGFGSYNEIVASGDNSNAYGSYNAIYGSGWTSHIYGSDNYIASYGGYTNQTLYGVRSQISPHAGSVVAYGEYIYNTASDTINNPTANQVGLYINWSIPGTDTGNKRWAIYNGSTNTTAGKVFLGIDNVKTYLGTGFDWSISASADAQANLNITREVGTGYIDFGAAPILTTGTLGAGVGTLTSLNLTATSNQIVLQSAGVTTTLTESGTSSNKVLTLPNATGTLAYSVVGTYAPIDTYINQTLLTTSTPTFSSLKVGSGCFITGGKVNTLVGESEVIRKVIMA